ncbi:MAG: hypothetical protein FJX65_12950 [Alphaproteobacteria bacterium]|nr:hypothetical protein [Alphaproteobacteria bacterium]
MRDQFNYHQMVDRSLRGVVREALSLVARDGLRGNHHMYISFRTEYAGVVLAEYLRAKYPKEMTIVLQHQFWDLDVREDGFDLTLSFNKVPERITVPFAAMTGFADPSVQFGLQFQGAERSENDDKAPAMPIPRPETATNAAVEKLAPPTPPSPPPAGEKVVALDQFRKK